MHCRDNLELFANVKVLTPEEMQRIESWAKNAQIAKMLSFFDALPRFIHVPQPLLLGCNGESEILVAGEKTVNQIRALLSNLDEPFNPHLRHQRIFEGRKRKEPHNSFSSIHKELQNGFPKICLLEGTGQCGQKIIRAHSLQKSVFKHHAKNGHVYQFEPFTGTRDVDKDLWPDLIGINEATTFLGFCEHHDSQIFSPIEKLPFQNTPEQRFLHHYRAFAQMYYDKACKFQIIENVVNDMRKTFNPSDLNSMDRHIALNQLDANELKQQKVRFDQQLQSRDWSSVEGYAFVGENMPNILTTNLFAPRKDFHGRIFQDTKSPFPLKWVSFTVTAAADRAVFLLCGEKGCPVLREFVASFREMPLQTAAIITYVFCIFENFIILPNWWDSISKDTRQRFANAFQGRYYRRELPNTCDWKLKEVPS